MTNISSYFSHHISSWLGLGQSNGKPFQWLDRSCHMYPVQQEGHHRWAWLLNRHIGLSTGGQEAQHWKACVDPGSKCVCHSKKEFCTLCSLPTNTHNKDIIWHESSGKGRVGFSNIAFCTITQWPCSASFTGRFVHPHERRARRSCD